MPWKETCPMKERVAFIEAWLSREFSLSELCRRFGISRKTGYKWIARFTEEGRSGLTDRRRCAHHHPNQTPDEIVAALLAAKHRHPDWGPVTLIKWLRRRQPQRPWPAPSTAGEILKRHGLVRPRQRRKRVPPHSEPLHHATAPGVVWSADYKGDFLMANGRRCYPLTLFDNYSRFLIDCKGMYAIGLDPVMQRYERAFHRWGLPQAIRTDNGYPFASCGIGGLNALSIWLLKLDVMPERIAPGHPEQNPRHERMHRTLKHAAIDPPKANLSAQQRAFNRFRDDYNYERPHSSLQDQVPAQLFTGSLRRYPQRLPDVVYDHSYEVRRVRRDGTIKWRGHQPYLSQALAKEPVGLRRLGHQRWQIYFAKMALGVLDARLNRIIWPK